MNGTWQSRQAARRSPSSARSCRPASPMTIASGFAAAQSKIPPVARTPARIETAAKTYGRSRVSDIARTSAAETITSRGAEAQDVPAHRAARRAKLEHRAKVPAAREPLSPGAQSGPQGQARAPCEGSRCAGTVIALRSSNRPAISQPDAGIAQLDRALASEAKGRWFESSCSRHFNPSFSFKNFRCSFSP